MTSSKETVFIYCRVSTEKQDTERQLRELTQFAKDKNLNVAKVYEETMSGTKSLVGRRMLLDAIALCKPKYVLISDYSRFGRNVKTALMMKDELHELGICLWSMQNGLKSLEDDGTPNITTQFIFTALMSVYEQENARRIREIKSGLSNAKAKGVILGRPFGKTVNRLVKYKKVVDTIKEQEELKAKGYKYLSVRKTAAYHNIQKSLIQEIRNDMKAEGLIQGAKWKANAELVNTDTKPRQFKDSNQNIITMDIV